MEGRPEVKGGGGMVESGPTRGSPRRVAGVWWQGRATLRTNRVESSPAGPAVPGAPLSLSMLARLVAGLLTSFFAPAALASCVPAPSSLQSSPVMNGWGPPSAFLDVWGADE